MRVLGIDTSLRSTGVGIVERDGARMVSLAHETLKVGRSAPHSECLQVIHAGVEGVIGRFAPEAVSIEGVFSLPERAHGRDSWSGPGGGHCGLRHRGHPCI